MAIDVNQRSLILCFLYLSCFRNFLSPCVSTLTIRSLNSLELNHQPPSTCHCHIPCFHSSFQAMCYLVDFDDKDAVMSTTGTDPSSSHPKKPLITHPPLLFALPPVAMRRAVLTSLEIEHACLCLSPPLVGLSSYHQTQTLLTEGVLTGNNNNNNNINNQVVGLGSGNVKSVEGQLELLLLPSRRLDRNEPLLVDFDRQVDEMTPICYFSYCFLSYCSSYPTPHQQSISSTQYYL